MIINLANNSTTSQARVDLSTRMIADFMSYYDIPIKHGVDVANSLIVNPDVFLRFQSYMQAHHKVSVTLWHIERPNTDGYIAYGFDLVEDQYFTAYQLSESLSGKL